MGSSSRVERSDAGKGSLESSEPSVDRIVYGATLLFLESGVEVDAVRATPPGGWPAIGGTTKTPLHDVGSYESEFGSRDAF